MKKVCAILLTLAVVISTLPLSFAVMITGIVYEPIKKQFFYETEGEWRSDGGDDYFHCVQSSLVTALPITTNAAITPKKTEWSLSISSMIGM